MVVATGFSWHVPIETAVLFEISAFPSGLAVVWHFLVTKMGSSEKIFHSDNFRCDTRLIYQIAAALLGKYKYYQEIKP